MEFEQFKALVTLCHDLKQQNDQYLGALPSDVGFFIGTNDYSERLHQEIAALRKASFGEFAADVQWFLEEWRPGFEINVMAGPLGPREYIIQDLGDYLEYARIELFGLTPNSSP